MKNLCEKPSSSRRAQMSVVKKFICILLAITPTNTNSWPKEENPTFLKRDYNKVFFYTK